MKIDRLRKNQKVWTNINGVPTEVTIERILSDIGQVVCTNDIAYKVDEIHSSEKRCKKACA
jgi:hypothetical protein